MTKWERGTLPTIIELSNNGGDHGAPWVDGRRRERDGEAYH